MAPYSTLEIQKEGALSIVTLNRPSRLNALDRQLTEDMLHYFSGLREDYDTRVVILRGAGKAFCAGLDLKDNADVTTVKSGDRLSAFLKGQRRLANVFRQMRQCPQPIIACVHGAATGGGLGMALAADIRMVTPEAKFNVAMFKMGMTGGDMGISYFLPRLCGLSVASELMMTGRFIDGTRAVRVNLASELYATPAEMEVGARAMAQEMLAGEANALRLTKECLAMSVDAPSFDAAVALEDRQQTLLGIAGDWSRRIKQFNAKGATPSSKL